MQIEIYNPGQGQPLPPIQWNYSELKAQLSAALESYKGRVYTDDTVSVAKKDRATLNKLAQAIDAKRREMKAVYLKPYEEFETQAKELTEMVKLHSAEIDAQIKTFEKFRRKEKEAEIRAMYSAMIGNLSALVPYERIQNPKWLNVTTSMASVSDEMGRSIDKIVDGLASIDKLNLDADIAAQVKGVFLQRFDLAEAIAEKERIEKQREELDRYRAAQEVENHPVRDESENDKYTQEETETPERSRFSDGNKAETIHTVTFRIRVTSSQLKSLGDFMKANHIRPERV